MIVRMYHCLGMIGIIKKLNLPLSAAIMLVFLARGTAQAASPHLPVLAVDPLPSLALLENHTEALQRWVSRGFSQTVLLHIDTQDRTRPLRAGQTAALAALKRARTAEPPAPAVAAAPGGKASFETVFARAAVALGIAREVYWIIPFEYFGNPDAAAVLRAEMKISGFSEDELRTFSLRDGCFRGTVAAAPFAVCGLQALPRVQEPILAAIDADFVLSAAAVAEPANPIAQMRKLLEALAERKYAVLDAVFCASGETAYAPRTTPFLRWVGETTAQALREPALLAAGAAPKRWTVLSKLALLFDRRDYSELFHQVLPQVTVREDDPALQLFTAQALAGQGKMHEAQARAEEACRLNLGYCYSLPEFGLLLLAGGDIEGGERFFNAGEHYRPEMTYGQVARGLFLMRADRLAAALRVFQALNDRGETLPAAFLAGALHLRLGDRQAARLQFDRALEALRVDPEVTTPDPDTQQAIREAADLYREEGLPRVAEELEGNPLLWIRLEGDPPEAP